MNHDEILNGLNSVAVSLDKLGHRAISDKLHSIIQSVERMAKMPVWQDLGTAPRDGTEIIAVDDDGIIQVVRWGKHNHVPLYGWIRQIELYGEEVDGFDAINWMPLPTPPEAALTHKEPAP
jgi:hypothetical protein